MRLLADTASELTGFLIIFLGCMGLIVLITILVVRAITFGVERKARLLAKPRPRGEPSIAAPPPQILPPGSPPALPAGSRAAQPAPAPSPTRTAVPAQPTPAPPSAPDLSLGSFAPISADQLRSQAGGLDPRRNFLFGRRDLIPPVSDPRTLLIDKALVAHGLLTPEELVRIHEVGQKMDAVRPDVAVAQSQAMASLAQLQQERQRIKQEKKRQAAERKAERARQVAQRKATDIIFLGRGVSKGLSDRHGNVERLQAAGLPVLATPADIAQALSIDIPRLRWLAFHSDASMVSHYVRFTVPKRSGGTRQLLAPHAQLAATQEWILRNILDKVPARAPAHGFVIGRSTVTNATPHVGRDVVVNADLEDFFPTIAFGRAKGIFRLMGYSPAAATILALLCTESPRRVVVYGGKTLHVATGPRSLPQGACTSPALSNLAARRLDSRLSGLASKLGWTYTRYADDMSFSASGDAAKKAPYLLARLRHIAAGEGFATNEKKTRVLRQAARQSVTGIVVNRRPGVARKLYKRLRAILHRAQREGLAAQNREHRPNFEAWLGGMIAYVSMVNPTQGQRLKAAFDRLGA